MAIQVYLENAITPPAIIVQDDGGGAPAGYTLTESIEDYDLYADRIVNPVEQRLLNYTQLKQKIEDRISTLGGYGSLTATEQEVADKWYLSTETERDLNFTDAEQQIHAVELAVRLEKDTVSEFVFNESGTAAASDTVEDSRTTFAKKIIIKGTDLFGFDGAEEFVYDNGWHYIGLAGTGGGTDNGLTCSFLMPSDYLAGSKFRVRAWVSDAGSTALTHHLDVKLSIFDGVTYVDMTAINETTSLEFDGISSAEEGYYSDYLDFTPTNLVSGQNIGVAMVRDKSDAYSGELRVAELIFEYNF